MEGQTLPISRSVARVSILLHGKPTRDHGRYSCTRYFIPWSLPRQSSTESVVRGGPAGLVPRIYFPLIIKNGRDSPYWFIMLLHVVCVGTYHQTMFLWLNQSINQSIDAYQSIN